MSELFPELIQSAEFSPCRTYRYLLRRVWRQQDDGTAMFIGLNPSTADETNDDPTIRRCIGFAKAWGCSGMVMANLFAFRATDPKIMKACAEPVGPENDAYLLRCAKNAEIVVAAWGTHGRHLNRSVEVAGLLGMANQVHCLGVNKDGSPKHPLYLAKKAELMMWPV